MDNKLKHLEFIQNVISKMSDKSFLIKGWCITIIAGVFSLTINESGGGRILLILITTIFTFWMIDSYFLQQERKYRFLYDLVRQQTNEEINFDMNVPISTDSQLNWNNCFFSKSIVLFYGLLVLISAFSFIDYTIFCN